MAPHKVMVLFCLFVAVLSVQVKGAGAQTLRDEVLEITPPFELKLKKTGPIRLAGLLYDEKVTALNDLIKPGDKVKLRLLSNKPDRYNRKAAHVYLDDGTWVQGALVSQGQAIPFPYEGEETLVRDLYLLEGPKVFSALNTDMPTDQFAIVEGRVVDVAHVKGTTYLNFGANWRDDFTVKIPKANHYIFKRYGLKTDRLKDKRIRIRGWVSKQNGPMIEARHPAQIEVIER
ncbi:MAG: hypothetical protein HWE30_12520 [Methylocystaceae bacterium]|nr:hypothetical protein [Methylocystaceae bacterium]